ncbi:hypothetical protein NC652_034640 [Populus alba x Populus x berolinensis]|uniref:Uncharacterized protein n=1 Tax=Populus alba x Populus x berolinensis TaxID=444605 RepID=A0AAD6PWF0_9ROSI|nr:hypothetical protein NC652_034640 [Populus alba x Populus x berolinensis]KAJ6970041.1 hypothetical protein NC653_034571 [Populus alba x Populus x berolinensis]
MMRLIWPEWLVHGGARSMQWRPCLFASLP